MKRFLVLILAVFLMSLILREKEEVCYLDVQKVFINERGHADQVLLDITGKEFLIDKELPEETWTVVQPTLNYRYLSVAVHGGAIFAIIIAMLAAIMFGWQFEPFIAAVVGAFVGIICITGVFVSTYKSQFRTLNKVVYEMRGDKIKSQDFNQRKEYFKNLSLNEMIEIANRANFRHIAGLKKVDADKMNKAVVAAYDGKITNFDMRTMSLLAINRRLNEADINEARMKFSYNYILKELIKPEYKKK